ncbi:MAG: DNA replication and repair protein RecF [gamma proteobacterium symbiont of Bathyaustriella thionipta]|nr:DNA replication and repair protein RecF [gamma proteobacterium symbiont of Bathyaustriella thionipta]MCU7949387.1 DNA replication and repair protein RecF [gamma proteobacterium symbiont of Bathyaustriella thionipta]MCU7952523.1 DNA replication and repair protein RecF [gamma proteobacterium symbiont of Bathyaustriella thionipta]MCU7955969.1 DNA replication and repair protein RecF [gamma proteobacterium symbiont of Bathyaustriella thionipta]MCU7968430.1 DNA replication and repair protein RecF 
MPLELLKIHNGRNLIQYSLRPHPKFNIIYGSNGVGKTTILESIYLLLRSRTFRNNKFKTFINYNENTCTVFSRFSSLKENTLHASFSIGISRSKDKVQPVLHLNSNKINSLSSITNLVVLGLITPESFNLLDAGPSIRRKFIDWGVFHVEPFFLNDWRSFKKVLSSRNSILSKLSKKYRHYKKIGTDELELINCWNPQLLDLNNKLDVYRSNQVKQISHYFKKYLFLFSSTLSENISLSYSRGWTKELNFSQYLKDKIYEDLLAGYTRYGTHRCELKIALNNNLAKEILSRSQKKIVIICLILAQFRFLVDTDPTREHNVLLLDDIDSELDSKNLNILFTILSTLPCQTLATTTNKSRYDFMNEKECELFHVEHK